MPYRFKGKYVKKDHKELIFLTCKEEGFIKYLSIIEPKLTASSLNAFLNHYLRKIIH
jgi:hypothetical protein